MKIKVGEVHQVKQNYLFIDLLNIKAAQYEKYEKCNILYNRVLILFAQAKQWGLHQPRWEKWV